MSANATPTAIASARRPPPGEEDREHGEPAGEHDRAAAVRAEAVPGHGDERQERGAGEGDPAEPAEEQRGAAEGRDEQHRLEEVGQAEVAGVLTRAEGRERRRGAVDPQHEQIGAQDGDEERAEGCG